MREGEELVLLGEGVLGRQQSWHGWRHHSEQRDPGQFLYISKDISKASSTKLTPKTLTGAQINWANCLYFGFTGNL